MMEKTYKKGDCSVTLRQCYADDNKMKELIAYQPFNLIIMDKRDKKLQVFSERDNIDNIFELKRNYNGRQYSTFPLYIDNGIFMVDTERKPINEDIGVIAISRKEMRLKHPKYKLMPLGEIMKIVKGMALEYMEAVNTLVSRMYYDVEIKKNDEIQTLRMIPITDKEKLKKYILGNIKFMDKEFDEILDELCKE